MPPHELLDFGIGVPLFAVDLIPAHMEITVGKQVRHLIHELVEKLISALARGVHGGVVDAPGALDLVGAGGAGQLGVADEPGNAVSGYVEFGYDANAAVVGVGDQVANVILGVIKAVGAFFLQLGKGLAFHAKSLVIGKVEV